MEVATAKKIVNEHVEWLRWALGLQHWTIHIVYKRLGTAEGQTVLGRCETNRRYREATISIDNDEIESETQILRVLRHELLHVFHAGFETYRQMAHEMIDGKAMDAMDVAFHDSIEAVVAHIEHMLDAGLGLDAKGVVARAKAHAKKRG